jgi:excisionase family DNA binding protein
VTVEDRRLAYSVDEAAAALGVSRELVYDLIRRGELYSRKLGRRRVVPRAALEALLAGRPFQDLADPDVTAQAWDL